MLRKRDHIYNELLVIKCQQNDRAAFEELVDRWQGRLWGYAFKMTGCETAAWDAVQETWCSVIKGLRKLDDVGLFPCWVFRILNNKCADFQRKQKLKSRLHNDFESKIRENQTQNSNEKTDLLESAVEKLPPDRKVLITLRYREDFNISQIAEILDIPAGTVKSRLNRTISTLRQLMEQNKNG